MLKSYKILKSVVLDGVRYEPGKIVDAQHDNGMVKAFVHFGHCEEYVAPPEPPTPVAPPKPSVAPVTPAPKK